MSNANSCISGSLSNLFVNKKSKLIVKSQHRLLFCQHFDIPHSEDGNAESKSSKFSKS